LHAPTLLVGCATGDMAGTGTWELAVAGAGTRVRVRDTWTLDLHTRWMRLAAPFMAPLFRWNHEDVMRAGGRGLARWLGPPAAYPRALMRPSLAPPLARAPASRRGTRIRRRRSHLHTEVRGSGRSGSAGRPAAGPLGGQRAPASVGAP